MPIQSPFPDVEIPALSLFDYVFGSIAEEDLDRVALVDPKSGDTTSYRRLIAEIEAGALAARGIEVGDVGRDPVAEHPGIRRLKELIKYKGYQVPPAELEALLLTNPKVADAAVIGVIEDETGEEIPKAFVVTQPHAALTADEVIDFVARQVAPYKKVRAVEFVEQIPKSASGKILRNDLRRRTSPAR